MMLPPAGQSRQYSSFLQYSADCMEPWDGPAALAFTDGAQVGVDPRSQRLASLSIFSR